jgi:hypothetical protein
MGLREVKRISKTQMAATPTLYGEDAERLIESLKNKPTEKSRENAKKLIEYFDKIENRPTQDKVYLVYEQTDDTHEELRGVFSSEQYANIFKQELIHKLAKKFGCEDYNYWDYEYHFFVQEWKVQ